MQLSVHDNVNKALEWILYDKLYDIKYITKDEFGKVYRANWIDGYISNFQSWDDVNKNWKRNNFNMLVKLKSLNSPNDLTFEFVNKIKIEYEFYGMTLDPETKNYLMRNDDIDKFIQDTQLSAHDDDVRGVLEWIPYDRFYGIKYILKDEFSEVYRANWIDGCISNFRNWDDVNQNWKRNNLNMFVNLKSLNTPNDLTFELANKVVNKIKIEYEFYGITQDPETKNYMMVLNNKCKNCKYICSSIHFQHKFIDWTSGNDDIDKFIQDTQLSAHVNLSKTLEWIPYDRFYDIKYISKDAL
ncbi:unnamed protein product [Rhizophagus irregularis]|nr:unnamed protein product [Rhizophagus irregularis]